MVAACFPAQAGPELFCLQRDLRDVGPLPTGSEKLRTERNEPVHSKFRLPSQSLFLLDVLIPRSISFLLETQNWRELEDLITGNRIAMGTIPEPIKEIYLLSSTKTHVASM